MPPANSPSSPTETPLLSSTAASPYLQQLEAISSPVPDLAATLTTQTEEDANDENVSFLRTRLRNSPESSPSSGRRRQQFLPREEYEPSQREIRTNGRRMLRTVEMNHRIPVVRQQQDGRNSPRNYGERIPERQSLYDWAPGSNWDLGSDDEDEEVREELPSYAQSRWYARAQNREEAEASPRTLRPEDPSRPPSQTQRETSPHITIPSEYGESSLVTTALLQSVRRHPRFSSRTRSTLHNYILDRERAGQEADERERPTSTSTRPHRSANSNHNDPYRQFSQSDIRARIDAHRQMCLQNPSASMRLREAIKYLDRVRFSSSYEESISCAAAGGFVRAEFFTRNEDDFILDTSTLSPPAESSWLRPGSIFSGFQHAAASNTMQMMHHRLTSLGGGRDVAGRNIAERNRSSSSALAELNRIAVSTTSGRHDWAQNVAANLKDDRWPVKVTIHNIDYDTMTLCGTMEAHNIPDKSSPTQEANIITYLEGEIIDFNTHALETKSFKADAEVDSTYWRELQPFKNLTDEEIVRNLVSRKWITEELNRYWILMRWKERCFITPSDSRQGLTISGFYYISLRREDGQIDGLYYDPGSSPYQQLGLKPEWKGGKKMFPAYGFR